MVCGHVTLISVPIEIAIPITSLSCFTVYYTQDVAVRTVDSEVAFPGMTYLFSAPKNHHLMMPEVAILSEEKVTGTSVEHQSKPHLTEEIDVENTSILAKEMGVSLKQLMANQKAALKVAKEAQELKQLERAVPDLNIDDQKAALYAFEREKNETKVTKRSEGNAHLHPGTPQKQHSYEPVLNGSPSSLHKHLAGHAQSPSLAQGEQIYNRLDPRGYQQSQLHEHSRWSQASPRDLSEVTNRKYCIVLSFFETHIWFVSMQICLGLGS